MLNTRTRLSFFAFIKDVAGTALKRRISALTYQKSKNCSGSVATLKTVAAILPR